MEVWLLLFFVAILLVGGVVLGIITRRGGTNNLNVDKYRTEWLNIEQSVAKDNEMTCHMAILNADKLLDKALQQRGAKGETMGERMKSSQKTWSNANSIWSAHKLRNQIAHETNVKVNYQTCRQALRAFKQGLKDLGAI